MPRTEDIVGALSHVSSFHQREGDPEPGGPGPSAG